MTQITFITGNPGKAERIRKHLPIELLHQAIDLNEIQSLNLQEVAGHKAQEAYKFVQGPVLVEDVSLVFNALGALPGPLIKWFLKELDNPGLCKLLDGYTDRSAVAKVCFALFDGKETHFFENERTGTIVIEPRGKKLFGWDTIFIPDGYEKTWGEMTEEETVPSSMRRPALKKLETFLQSK